MQMFLRLSILAIFPVIITIVLYLLDKRTSFHKLDSRIKQALIGAVLRKFMFDDKKPSWPYAFAITLVTEVMHMLMIFITNMSDVSTAFNYVEDCSLPMISVNAISVMLSVLLVSLIGSRRRFL